MRFIVTFLMLLAGLGFGIGNTNASPTGKRVALLSMANTNPWVSAWTSSFIKEAEARGMKVTNLTSPYDAAQQSQQVDDAIAQKFDLIAHRIRQRSGHRTGAHPCQGGGRAGRSLGNAAGEEARQPVSCPMSAPTTANSAASRPKTWSRRLPTEGKTKAQVVAITGLAQQLMVQLRMVGFREVLAKHPDIKLVAQEDGKWNTAVTEKIASQLLVRFNGRGGIDGMFGMADNQATGIIQAVESAGHQARRRQQGHRRRRQQLHEGRHHPYQGRPAV